VKATSFQVDWQNHRETPKRWPRVAFSNLLDLRCCSCSKAFRLKKVSVIQERGTKRACGNLLAVLGKKRAWHTGNPSEYRNQFLSSTHIY